MTDETKKSHTPMADALAKELREDYWRRQKVKKRGYVEPNTPLHDELAKE